jgi:antirestriction protein ArdC
MSNTVSSGEALDRARGGNSTINYGAIFDGFVAKGIAPEEIKPRENVFTYDAWLALGRVVRRGEHGVRVVTLIPMRDVQHAEAERAGRPARPARFRFAHTTVFHYSQTDKR